MSRGSTLAVMPSPGTPWDTLGHRMRSRGSRRSIGESPITVIPVMGWGEVRVLRFHHPVRP
jgi:hypothetical protein